jgi:predicted ester cyclase
MPPTPKAQDWQPILNHLTGSLGAIRELQNHLSLGAAAVSGPVPVVPIHDTLVQYWLGKMGPFSQTILRPLSPNVNWVDKPTGKSFGSSDYDKTIASAWQVAFPDFREDIVNTIGNEDYLVVESKSTGTHSGPLRVAGTVIPATGAKVTINSAAVVKLKAGQAIQVECYYDIAGLLRAMKLIPDMPMGHDETAQTMPAILHASGFQGIKATVAPGRPWPPRIGAPSAMGHGNSAAAKANAEGCKAIHQAFIEHKSDQFASLIAQDSVWIDVPTGQVLNGAAAAATHDQGNWMKAFPDSSAQVLNLIANEDWCVVQHRGFGKHLGPLTLGGKVFPPTGKSMEMQVLDINQYKNGKVVLIRNYYDMAMMMMQLGLMTG